MYNPIESLLGFPLKYTYADKVIIEKGKIVEWSYEVAENEICGPYTMTQCDPVFIGDMAAWIELVNYEIDGPPMKFYKYEHGYLVKRDNKLGNYWYIYFDNNGLLHSECGESMKYNVWKYLGPYCKRFTKTVYATHGEYQSGMFNDEFGDDIQIAQGKALPERCLGKTYLKLTAVAVIDMCDYNGPAYIFVDNHEYVLMKDGIPYIGQI